MKSIVFGVGLWFTMSGCGVDMTSWRSAKLAIGVCVLAAWTEQVFGKATK